MGISHRTVGSGPHTVFCLHGLFGSADGWGVLPDYLGQVGDRQGLSGEVLDEVAQDVLDLADELGAQTFSLIGHSMGGAEVLRVLAKAPERVRKLIGIAPVGAEPVPLDDAGHDLFFGAVDDRARRVAIIDFTTGNRLTSRWIEEVADWSLTHSTPAAFHGALVAWTSPDFLAQVAGASTPMLVIAGAHDPALGEATVRATWEPNFPRCTIEVMDNAGHYPMFETPVALATSIERFLRD